MNHAYFNRILHLLQQRPQQGKRLIGLGATAFGELWHRVEEQDKMTRQRRADRPGRQRQAGGGMDKSANVSVVSATALDDAVVGRDARLQRSDGVELHP